MIGDISIPCYVLEDGTRVISGRGMINALGMRQGHGGFSTEIKRIPSVWSALSPELADTLATPLKFIRPNGGHALGYEATILADLCDAVLQAYQDGTLSGRQESLAHHAMGLTRAFAKVGIIALIDEATGYQESRDRDELHKLLGLYLSEEKLRWAKAFPDEFYRQIYRLMGWTYNPLTTRRTPYLGILTNRLVYEKLPPGVLEELCQRNPVVPETKRRGAKHHQFLSEALGRPDLRDHLLQVIALMKGAHDWRSFEQSFDRVFPSPRPLLDGLDEAG